VFVDRRLGFAGAARVYQSMLTDANKANPSFVFNQRFPGSAVVVINNREMAGAYTKPGFAFMQAAMKNPTKYVNGEQWVLGDQASAAIDTAKDDALSDVSSVHRVAVSSQQSSRAHVPFANRDVASP